MTTDNEAFVDGLLYCPVCNSLNVQTTDFELNVCCSMKWKCKAKVGFTDLRRGYLSRAHAP